MRPHPQLIAEVEERREKHFYQQLSKKQLIAHIKVLEQRLEDMKK